MAWFSTQQSIATHKFSCRRYYASQVRFIYQENFVNTRNGLVLEARHNTTVIVHGDPGDLDLFPSMAKLLMLF